MAYLNRDEREKLMNELPGTYETYRGTIRVKICAMGDLLKIEYPSADQSPPPTILFPEFLAGDEPRFYTISEGAKLLAQFRRTQTGTELVFERYKFRRTGNL